jgi:L-lactate dehydrogenase complex protein LldG
MMGAKEEILARLRIALRDVPTDEALDGAPVPRDYRTSGGIRKASLLKMLTDRLVDYKASVHRCKPDALVDTVGKLLSEKGSLVVPADLPKDWYSKANREVLIDSTDQPLDLSTLDITDSVLTGCAVAIAETGTIVLDGAEGQGRRVISLVPDHHVCVVRAEQVVGLVPEGIGRLDGRRPLTFISGPSATSDIELRRVEGVHGPRRLDVILVT